MHRSNQFKEAGKMVSFKVYIKGTGEIRRVGVPIVPKYDAVVELMRNLFPEGHRPASFKVQWKDEDNDFITVGSQMEWEEAVEAHAGVWPIRLYLSTEENSSIEQAVEQEKVEEKTEEEEKVEKIIEEELEEKLEEKVEAIEEKVSTLDLNDVPARELAMDYLNGPYSVESIECGSNVDQAKVARIVRAAVRDMVRQGCLSSIIFKGSSDGDMLVDVDVPKLAYAMHRQACSLLREGADSHDYRNAYQLLTHVIALEPWNASAHYNMACTLSLSGEVERALAYLKLSLEKGFSDFDNMMTDPDLKNIRDTLEFADLLKSSGEAEEEKKEDVAVVSDEEKVEEKGEKIVEEKVEMPKEPIATIEDVNDSICLEKGENCGFVMIDVQNDEKEEEEKPASSTVEEEKEEKEEVEEEEEEEEPAKSQLSPSLEENREQFAEQLEHLHSMGYDDDEMNILLLLEHKGDVVALINSQLDSRIWN